jgi:hypothetical protein
MIDKDTAARQIARMEYLTRFPKTPSSADELLMAMMSAHSPFIAEKTVSEFVHWGDNTCPSPADLRRALHARYETEEDRKPKAKPPQQQGLCRKCHGWGCFGERPNVQFCECPTGDSLRVDIPNWCELSNRMPKSMPGGRTSRDRRWNPDADLLRSAGFPLPMTATLEMPAPALPAKPERTTAELEAELAAQTRQYRKPEETREIVEELNAELAEWLNQPDDEEPE